MSTDKMKKLEGLVTEVLRELDRVSKENDRLTREIKRLEKERDQAMSIEQKARGRMEKISQLENDHRKMDPIRSPFCSHSGIHFGSQNRLRRVPRSRGRLPRDPEESQEGARNQNSSLFLGNCDGAK